MQKCETSTRGRGLPLLRGALDFINKRANNDDMPGMRYTTNMSKTVDTDAASNRKVRVSIDMPEALRFALKHAALRERLTLREYVLRAVRERLTASEEEE